MTEVLFARLDELSAAVATEVTNQLNIAGALLKTQNLADLNSISTARNNLGLTSLATTTPAAGIVSFLTTPSSANLAAALTDKTGTGVNAFATSPTFVTPILGAATATTLTIGGTPAEADPLWVGGILGVNNIGAVKASGTMTGTISHTAIIWIEPSFGATAAITDWGALRINDANVAGGYTLDAQYQLRIQNPTRGVINQAIYTEGVGRWGAGTSNAQAHVHINENSTANPAPPASTLFYISGAAAGTAQMSIDSFGAGGISQIATRFTRGTGAAPNTAVQTNDNLGNYTGAGNDGTNYFVAASMAFTVTANWTSGPSHPTAIDFNTCPIGGNFATQAARITPSGGFNTGGVTTDFGAGSIRGTSGGIGYATGASAGGAVTQITSRVTGVTLNKISGQITLFSAAGSGANTAFTVTNSTVAATDTVTINSVSGTDKYIAYATNVAAGSFIFNFLDFTGTTVEAPVFQFNVIKGANT